MQCRKHGLLIAYKIINEAYVVKIINGKYSYVHYLLSIICIPYFLRRFVDRRYDFSRDKNFVTSFEKKVNEFIERNDFIYLKRNV